MIQFNLGLIIFSFSIASRLASTIESLEAPANDSNKDSAPTEQHLSQTGDTFNLSALANAVQESTNSSMPSPSPSSSYHLIDGSGSLAEPKQLYHATQNGGHSNHRDYPGEPYPSASYTSQIIMLASNATPKNQTHHPAQTGPAGQSRSQSFTNSFGNQSPSSSRDHDYSTLFGHQQPHNHNYGAGNQPLDAGLIQNLTAALFPVKQISNVTLQTLSDLLNKTRHTNNNISQQQQYRQQYFNQASPYQTINRLRPLATVQQQQQPLNYNQVYANYYSSPAFSGHPMSPHLTNSFDTDVGSSQLNSLLFDQLKQVNKFGFREPSSAISKNHLDEASGSRHQLNKPIAAKPTNLKLPLNIYSSYGSLTSGADSSASILPLLTSGQSLAHLAAGVVSSGNGDTQQQLDLLSDSMRLPVNQQQSNSQPRHYHNHQYNSQTSKPSASNNNYNYIQHHQGAQDHLDKVIYHSTPFRPSIVSPPASMAQQTYNSSSASQTGNKPMAFGTLSSPSTSSISESKSADYTLSSGAANNNSGRYLKGSGGASSSQLSEKQVYPVIFNEEPRQTVASQQRNSTLMTGNVTLSSTLVEGESGGHNKLQVSSQSSPLLDIYEREIDQQIRDAFSNERGNILASMASRLVQSPSNLVAGGELPAWTYDEPSVDQSLLASWIRAGPAGSQLIGSQLALASPSQQMEQFERPLPGSSPYHQPIDTLAAALHELPTFSASDLQPIYPSMQDLTSSLVPTGGGGGGGGIFSPITSASQELPMEQTLAGSPGSWSLPSSGYLNAQSSSLGDTLWQSLQQLFNSQQPQPQPQPQVEPKKHKHQNNHMEQATTSNVSNLPSILYKLNPLAPFFSNPFNHLHSSSSQKNTRHNTKMRPPMGQQATGGEKTSASYAYNLLSKLPLSAASESRYHHHQLTGHPDASRQQQQQQLASLLANLMASAQTNLHVADASELTKAPAVDHSGPFFKALAEHASLPAGSQAYGALNPLDAPASLGLSLSGGGISPLFWRSLFPSTMVQRQPASATSIAKSIAGGHKTTNAGSVVRTNPFVPLDQATMATNGFLAHNQPTGSQRLLQSHAPATSTSPLISGGSRAAISTGPLLVASSHKQPAQMVSQSNYKPKLKIKILRIPIAVYDRPASSSMGQQQPAAISLLPANQAQAAASLLAGMPCPIQHNNDASQQAVPHTIDKHLANNNNLSALLAADTMNSAESLSSPSTASLIDINSSDLQESNLASSTSSLQEKLLQLLN